MTSEEVLPPGVGRVPMWWMEITPHYTLDEEDEQVRQMAEDQMAFYYMQLAAADDAGYLLPDGTPKLGADLKPLVWKPTTPWNGRSGDAKDGSANMGPGGRNFKPGHTVIDPKLFGILESDPDYKAYLTGAKLPPGYFEKMGELANSDGGGTQGIMNNLKQTDYGRYGRQAEAPNFKPVWAKKKLRSTTTGANIRQGQYNDSPNKFVNLRRVEPNETPPKVPAGFDEAASEPTTASASASNVLAQIQQNRYEPDKVASPSATPEAATVSSTGGKQKRLVRKVRKVVRKKEDTPTAPTQHPELAKEERKPTWTHSDYYHNARPNEGLSEQEQKLKEQQEKLKRLQELQRQQQELLKAQQEKEKEAARQRQLEQEVLATERIKQQQQQLERLQQLQLQQQQAQSTQNQAANQQQPEFDEMSYEEEVIDDDDYTEGSYEEELIDDDDDNNELQDLQTILAAKQAELHRLQALGA
jgi:DNA segregation ATPase FtsK/SpoIIIE-like protein